MKSIPRRSFEVDLDGKKFVVKELSAAYLKQALDGGEDNSRLAIFDAIEDFEEKDFEHFGLETERKLYDMIIDFSYDPVLKMAEVKSIAEALNMKVEEFMSLPRESKLNLKAIVDARTPLSKEEVTDRKKP